MVTAWEETPVHHLRLDVRALLQDAVITEVCCSLLGSKGFFAAHAHAIYTKMYASTE